MQRTLYQRSCSRDIIMKGPLFWKVAISTEGRGGKLDEGNNLKGKYGDCDKYLYVAVMYLWLRGKKNLNSIQKPPLNSTSIEKKNPTEIGGE